MLTDLNTLNKVVGVKQLKKALSGRCCAAVFVGTGCRSEAAPIRICESCRSAAVPVEVRFRPWPSLAKHCGIEVGAAVAALLSEM